MAVLDATIKAIAAAIMQSSLFISPRRKILDQKKDAGHVGGMSAITPYRTARQRSAIFSFVVFQEEFPNRLLQFFAHFCERPLFGTYRIVFIAPRGAKKCL